MDKNVTLTKKETLVAIVMAFVILCGCTLAYLNYGMNDSYYEKVVAAYMEQEHGRGFYKIEIGRFNNPLIIKEHGSDFVKYTATKIFCGEQYTGSIDISDAADMLGM